MLRFSWTSFFCALSLAFAASAYAADSSVQTDITMRKISTLLKAEKYAEALPYFAQLESSGTPLPESFYYYQIFCLYKSNDVDATMAKADVYLNKYGKQGKYYDKVVDISGEFGIIKDERNKEEQARQETQRAAEEAYKKDLAKYEQDYADYKIRFDAREARIGRCQQQRMAEQNECIATHKKTPEQLAHCGKMFDPDRCRSSKDEIAEPKRPVKP